MGGVVSISHVAFDGGDVVSDAVEPAGDEAHSVNELSEGVAALNAFSTATTLFTFRSTRGTFNSPLTTTPPRPSFPRTDTSNVWQTCAFAAA